MSDPPSRLALFIAELNPAAGVAGHHRGYDWEIIGRVLEQLKLTNPCLEKHA